jgi:8-oxo-dGTP pyrophosphatase MutT (NUDIX family)
VNSRSIQELVRGLHAGSDGELDKSRDLVVALLAHTAHPYSRNQFEPGHLTCTGLVFSPAGDEVLIVHHRRLDRWLLPGGHIEPEDVEIWDAARREVVEETGAELEDDGRPVLAGIDVHPIPPGKGEPYHLHHDLLFAFRAKSKEFRLSSESREIAWAAQSEFARYDLPGNVRRAYLRAKSP